MVTVSDLTGADSKRTPNPAPTWGNHRDWPTSTQLRTKEATVEECNSLLPPLRQYAKESEKRMGRCPMTPFLVAGANPA